MQYQHYRVLYTTTWGIKTSKIFPNKEQAEDFAKTVKDAIVQDAREKVESVAKSSFQRNGMRHKMKTGICKCGRKRFSADEHCALCAGGLPRDPH